MITWCVCTRCEVLWAGESTCWVCGRPADHKALIADYHQPSAREFIGAAVERARRREAV